MKHHTGLDVISIQNRFYRILADCRHMRSQIPALNNHVTLCKPSAKTRRQVFEMANHGLVHIHTNSDSKLAFQFANEKKVVRSYVRQSNKTLSISQKNQVFSSSQEITLNASDKSFPKSRKDWIKLIWANSICSFSQMTGQQKMANRLNHCRATVNRNCKGNRYLVKTNQFVEIGYILGSGIKSLNQFKSIFPKGGYFAGRDRMIRKQLPNDYDHRKKDLFQFHGKSFRFENKALNRQIRAGRSNTGGIPMTKQVAWLRANRYRHYDGATSVRASIDGSNASSNTHSCFLPIETSFKALVVRKEYLPNETMTLPCPLPDLRTFADYGDMPSSLKIFTKDQSTIGYDKKRDAAVLVKRYGTGIRCIQYPEAMRKELAMLEAWGINTGAESRASGLGLLEPLAIDGGGKKVRKGSYRQIVCQKKTKDENAIGDRPNRSFMLSRAEDVKKLPGTSNFQNHLERTKCAALALAEWRRSFFVKEEESTLP